MQTIYVNIITSTLRKFIGTDGYASVDNGKTWQKNGTSEGLVKNLPYYKVLFTGLI